LTGKKESPEYIKTSLAGALSLGLEQGRFLRDTKCGCLNLLLTYEEGCAAKCGYCGLSSARDTEAKPTFIRVKWPVYTLKNILDTVRAGGTPFKRACVSMTTHPRALGDACTVIRAIREETKLPVSALLTPTVMRGPTDMAAVREAGADRVGIAVDCATEPLFEKFRGAGIGGPHRWVRYWEALEEAVTVFGQYRAGVHLIVGLGETEKEMVHCIRRAYQLGAVTHLFSFYPEAGSFMAGMKPPELEQYRRIQLARYLINEGIIAGDGIEYDTAGRLKDFGIEIGPYVERGVPFMTSGCPDEAGVMACNRPFSNERPSEPLRNYPFMPEADDLAVIRTQVKL
jgi:biotin synthase